MSVHTFHLTLSPTETLILSVDLTKLPISFVAYPIDLAAKYPKEYDQWLNEVVLPAITEIANEEQMKWFAQKGWEKLT